MSLYKKYRPSTFEEMIGNESEIESLKELLSQEKIPQVFLFTGPSGTGKTTLARIVANYLGATSFDVHEINSANNRGIDTAREIIENMKYALPGKQIKVYLIDECHSTSKDFQNAMLKPLEDTPKNVYFFLCTTDPSKLIKAFKTRCTDINLSSLDSDLIYRLVKKIAKQENMDIPKNILESLSENCEGSPRKALVLLEKLIGLKDEKSMKEIISLGEETEVQVIELCRILLKTNNWNQIKEILKSISEKDPEKIRYAVLGYMNSVLLSKDFWKAALIIECFSDPFYTSGKAGLTLACYQATHNTD
ncbi:MAG: AAA family ATPase [Candidatus Hodarchaeota archaeon]